MYKASIPKRQSVLLSVMKILIGEAKNAVFVFHFFYIVLRLLSSVFTSI